MKILLLAIQYFMEPLQENLFASGQSGERFAVRNSGAVRQWLKVVIQMGVNI